MDTTLAGDDEVDRTFGRKSAAELRERSNAMKAQWTAEKDAIQKIQAKKADLERLRITEPDGRERSWREDVRLYEPQGAAPPGFARSEPTLEDAYFVLMRGALAGMDPLGA